MAGSTGGHHEFHDRHEVPEGSSDRGFGLVFAGFFAILAAVSLWRGGPLWPWLGGIALAFLAVALLRAALLAPLNRLWMRFGLLLGRIVNPIVLALLFFAVFTPIALLARLLGKDFLRLRRDADATTYWIVREPPGPAPQSMKDQF